jgi:hypothetical protein
VCFIVCKTISELERAILTTLFLPVQKTPTIGASGRGICNVLFLWTCWRFHYLCKPTVAANDICLFGIKLTQDEAIHFEHLEFIIDCSNNSSPTPEGVTLDL